VALLSVQVTEGGGVSSQGFPFVVFFFFFLFFLDAGVLSGEGD
jgi:hypothetical protein